MMVNSDTGDAKRDSSPNYSFSKSVIETIDGIHHFELKCYSLCKGMGAGKYISSNKFNVGGYDWAMYFYPDGKNPEDDLSYVSVFIALASDDTDVRALFELTMLDQARNARNKARSRTHFRRSLHGRPYCLKCKGSMWGFSRFYDRSSLEESQSKYLKDDCLIFECKVRVVTKRMEKPKESAPPSDMVDNFKQLLDNEVGCDIVFEVGEETFKAHKVVLAARSPVFRALFFGLMGNPNTDTVVVRDVEPPIFKAMLYYIYSDSLPDVQEIMGSNSSDSVTFMMQHLLAAADRYGLDRLKLVCESKLCDEITVETVPSTLSLADQHSCAQLKTACLKFAAVNFNVMMQTKGYKYLEESCPSLLSELLETVSSADENSGLPSSKKRSNSSIVVGLTAVADGMRLRRRVSSNIVGLASAADGRCLRRRV